jgi:hypothetical protein
LNLKLQSLKTKFFHYIGSKEDEEEEEGLMKPGAFKLYVVN